MRSRFLLSLLTVFPLALPQLQALPNQSSSELAQVVQPPMRRIGELSKWHAVEFGVVPAKIFGEWKNIATTFGQRRNRERDNVQAEI